MKLIYIGNGKHITGIPARDLSADDISRIAGDLSMPETELIDLLILRGIYSRVPEPPKAAKKIEPIASAPIADNEEGE